VDSPAQVADLVESLLPQKLNGLYASSILSRLPEELTRSTTRN
jgi:hypothetical protein